MSTVKPYNELSLYVVAIMSKVIPFYEMHDSKKINAVFLYHLNIKSTAFYMYVYGNLNTDIFLAYHQQNLLFCYQKLCFCFTFGSGFIFDIKGQKFMSLISNL